MKKKQDTHKTKTFIKKHDKIYHTNYFVDINGEGRRHKRVVVLLSYFLIEK